MSNYRLSKKYFVFDGKRYMLYKKCSSHEEALAVARDLRNSGNVLAQVRHREVYVKRKN